MQKTHLDEILAGLVYLSDHEHFRAISMVALVEHGHIHIDHHALFQNCVVRDPVADYLIDASTAAVSPAPRDKG